MGKAWTTAELAQELVAYEQALQAANMTDQTVHTYVDRARRFINWLDGDYDPAVRTSSVRKQLGETRLRATQSHRS
jgi:hypothetical protein